MMPISSSRETMLIQPAASSQEFFAHLNTLEQIANPDNRNLLLNENLQETKKSGWRWIAKVILSPLCRLFYDLFSDVRMNRVAENLQEYLRVNQHYFADTLSLKEGIRAISDRIITPLKEKTHHRHDSILNLVLQESNNRLATLERADQEALRQREQAQQEAIQTLQATVQNLQAALQAEQTERQQAVQPLQVTVQNLQAALQTEQEERQQAVQPLQQRVQVLQAALQTEQAERQQAVQPLQQRVQVLQAALQTEQAERQQDVQVLQTALETEQTERQQEVQVLQAALQTEQTAHQQEVQDLHKALETEQTEREGMVQPFQREVKRLQTELQIELGGRQVAVQALQQRVEILETTLETEKVRREEAFKELKACQAIFHAFLNKGQGLNVSWMFNQSFTEEKSMFSNLSFVISSRRLQSNSASRRMLLNDLDISAIEDDLNEENEESEIDGPSVIEFDVRLLEELAGKLGEMNVFMKLQQGESSGGESDVLDGATIAKLKPVVEEMFVLAEEMDEKLQDVVSLDRDLEKMEELINNMIDLLKAQQEGNNIPLNRMLTEVYYVFERMRTFVNNAREDIFESSIRSEKSEERTPVSQQVSLLRKFLGGLSTQCDHFDRLLTPQRHNRKLSIIARQQSSNIFATPLSAKQPKSQTEPRNKFLELT